jgi:RNA polymerase sigma-70 factor (ECF subfamily)
MSPTAPNPAVSSDVPVDAARAARDHRLAALVAAAGAGDAAAFEAFYDATCAYAEALARRMLRGPDVEDLLAEAYFEAWRGATRFDATRGSAVTWLLTIVRSRALDALRRAATHPSAAGAEVDEDPADDGHDPADRLWQAESGTRLHAALAGLSAAERWVLGLAYFRELSHADIARTTGMPLGTVKSLILRAQAKLRGILAC